MTDQRKAVPAFIKGEELIIDPDADTLVKLLERTCRNYPEKGIIYVGSKGDEDFVSNTVFWNTCLKMLGGLQSSGFQRGDKVIVEIEDDKDFFFVFWSCILGGIIPCPINPPVSFEEDSEAIAKIVNVWNILDKPVMITDETKKNGYKKLNLVCLSVDDLQNGAEGAIYRSVRDDTAFLQFSSGSTGDPKGIIISHGNIVANIMQISIGAGLTDKDVCCGWLPHTHDMGLIGQHMSMLAYGILQIKMHPYVFIRRPFIFADKITKHRATIICTPNFGLKWLIDNITEAECEKLELSSLRIICNGAEPISVSVIRQFFQKFGKTGYREEAMFPAYGTAEAALGVSFHPYGVKPLIHRLNRQKLLQDGIAEEASKDQQDVVEFADEGYPFKGMSVRIADAGNQIVPERVIGEIQLQGPNLTRGYYNHPSANRESFTEGWYKTGDLGFIADKRLIITGRMKDIIFVRGQNYYAHDLENVIYEMPEVVKGMLAVIGVHGEKAGDEEILVLYKQKGSLQKFLSIETAIRRKLSAQMGIDVTHVIPVKKIARTTSGKLQRFKMRAEYERGLYDDVIKELQALKEAEGFRNRSAVHSEALTDLEAGIRKLWSDVLKIPEDQIGVQSRFLDLGGTSIKALTMLAGLERMTGRELSHTILLKCSTIRDVAEYLSAGDSEADKASLGAYVKNNDMKTANNGISLLHDIAVVGLALRFPGAKNGDELWRLLLSGKDRVTGIPEQRKQWAKTNNWEGFMAAIENPDQFDASFFAISDEEALCMDPQQRLMLMLAYEALEDGCLINRTKEELNAGVYIGAGFVSYQDIVKNYVESVSDDTQISPLTLVGNSLNMIAARVSHTFHMTGPAMTIDTACSSSLAAVEAAVAKLRDGSIDYALAGGVNLIFTPMVHRLSKRAGILSPGNRCRVFDIHADGTVLGEGAGMVLMQPLVTALKEGRKIYGVIKGVGINNDGDSLGPMAPNPGGQINVLARAYRDAGIDPGTVSYIEAHGTGTYIGDPVEARALSRFFRQFSDGAHFCGIGSMKSNIGHLLPAAGIAGLIKTLLCMKYKKLVPTLHVETVNPEIEIENSPLYMCTSARDWIPADGHPLRAGVSSFGFGGTNVHVVLEEAPLYENRETKERNASSFHILSVSGKTPDALKNNILRLKHFVAEQPDFDLADVCYTRNVCREHFTNRAVFVSGNKQELLSRFDEGGVEKMQISGRRTAFIFTDTGLPAMTPGLCLYQQGSLYAKYVDSCLSILKANVQDREIVEQLRKLFGQEPSASGEPDQLDEQWLAPLAIFVIDYSLGHMWLDFGIKPQYVLGYGIGEYAAAALAGLFSLDDALKLMARRCASLKAAAISIDHSCKAADWFRDITFRKPVLKFVSGRNPLENIDHIMSAGYWISNPAASGVFEDAVGFLRQNKCNIFLEAGIGSRIPEKIKSILPDDPLLVLDSLNPDGKGKEWLNILESLGRFYLAGYNIQWDRVYEGIKGVKVSLPFNAFDLKSYFL